MMKGMNSRVVGLVNSVSTRIINRIAMIISFILALMAENGCKMKLVKVVVAVTSNFRLRQSPSLN